MNPAVGLNLELSRKSVEIFKLFSKLLVISLSLPFPSSLTLLAFLVISIVDLSLFGGLANGPVVSKL